MQNMAVVATLTDESAWKQARAFEADAEDSLEGSLGKLSGSTLAQAVRLGGYSTRRVVVCNGWLKYYKDGQDCEKGSINLSANACCVSPDPLSSSRFTLSSSLGIWKDCNFTGADSGRVFYFDALHSEHSRSTWMQAIREQASPTLCQALSRVPIGKGAVPINELPTLLRSPKGKTKVAGEGLDKIGQANAECKPPSLPLPLLQETISRHVAALCGGDVPARYHAAEALALLKHDGCAARPALAKALLTDRNVHVRKSAARALGDIGDKAAEDVLWQAFQNDEDQYVRLRAEEALGALGASGLEARRRFPL